MTSPKSSELASNSNKSKTGAYSSCKTMDELREPMFEIFKAGYWVCYNCNKIYMKSDPVGIHLYVCLNVEQRGKSWIASASAAINSHRVTVPVEEAENTLPHQSQSGPDSTKVKSKIGKGCRFCGKLFSRSYIDIHESKCMKTNGQGIRRGRKSKSSGDKLKDQSESSTDKRRLVGAKAKSEIEIQESAVAKERSLVDMDYSVASGNPSDAKMDQGSDVIVTANKSNVPDFGMNNTEADLAVDLGMDTNLSSSQENQNEEDWINCEFCGMSMDAGLLKIHERKCGMGTTENARLSAPPEDLELTNVACNYCRKLVRANTLAWHESKCILKGTL